MITVERTGSVCTLIIDRPHKANALTRDMLRDIETATSEAERDGVAAFILTGRGTVFSAGADLEEAKAGLTTDGIWERVSTRIAGLPCLTVAALNGTLAGGAFGMVLACDLRVAVPTAKFFYPVMKLGYMPQPSDPQRLATLVGPSRAKMILMAGEKIDCETARSWGLVDRVVAPETLHEAVLEMTAISREAKPEICKGIKRLIA